MRKLIVSEYMTLDGIVQGPGGPEEDREGGFAFGGWSFHYWDHVMDEAMGRSMAVPSDLLLGRKTYEIFAAHWPYQPSDDPAAAGLNNAKKYVVSNTLQSVEWQNSTLISGDVASEIRRLKAQDGPDLSVIGSADLVQSLLQHALVDELRLWIFPLVVGKGKRLFTEGTLPGALGLISSQVSTTGVVMNTYVPGGDIKCGSFVSDTPSAKEIERRAKVAAER